MECLQLQDIIEKLVRQGKLIPYINSEFFKDHVSKYDGTKGGFNHAIPHRGENTNNKNYIR